MRKNKEYMYSLENIIVELIITRDLLLKIIEEEQLIEKGLCIKNTDNSAILKISQEGFDIIKKAFIKEYTIDEISEIINKTPTRVRQLVKSENLMEKGCCRKDPADKRIFLINEDGLNLIKNRSVFRGRKLKSGSSAQESIKANLLGVEFTSYRDAAEICGSSHTVIFNAIKEMKEKGEIIEVSTEKGSKLILNPKKSKK